MSVVEPAFLSPARRRDASHLLAPLVLVVWAAVGLASLLGGAVVYSMSIDDFMRLVQVRDLLGGQGWFDAVQHRIDPPAGVAMHWSRLVDAPIAALVYVLTPLAGRAGAEVAAAALWPLLLLLPALALSGALARRLAGDMAAIAAVLLAAIAAPAVVHFRIGALDHHGLQLVLILAAAWGATATGARWQPLLGGLAAALSLAVGIEMVPGIVAILAALGLRWAIEGAPAARATSTFGVAFGCGTAVLFAVTVPPAGWSTPACDAISAPWIAAAGLAGGTLALLASSTPRLATVTSRLAVGVGAGLGLMAVLAFAFSDCVRDPYADMDPRMAALWLTHVSEVRSALGVLRHTPAEFVPIYVPLFAALVLGAMAAWGAPTQRTLWLPPLFALAALTAVAGWEVRGASSANLLAQPLLAAAIVTLLHRHRAMMLTSLLAVSSPVLVFAGEGVGAVVGAVDAGRPRYAEVGPHACRRLADVAPLAKLAPGHVVSFVDLGPAILAGTGHAILAAPYHRNRAGNAAAFDVLVGDEKAARHALAEKHVDYVAVCPGAPERINYERAAPQGLAARLSRGETPAFLERVAGNATDPLWVYRVRR